MTPRPNAARIGLFALGGLALLIAAVVVVFGGRLFAATEQAVMHFRGSVYGLQAGSPVVFRGVRLGSVRSVGVVYTQGRFAVPVEVELDPAQIRTLATTATDADSVRKAISLVNVGEKLCDAGARNEAGKKFSAAAKLLGTDLASLNSAPTAQ